MRRVPASRAIRPCRARTSLSSASFGAWLVLLAAPTVSAAAPAGIPSPPVEDATTSPDAEPPSDAADPTPDATEPPPGDVTDPSTIEPPPSDPTDTSPSAPAVAADPVPIVSPVAPAPAIAPADPPPEAESEVGALTLRIEPGIGACLGRGCRHFRIGDATGSIGVGGSLAAHVAYRAARHLSFEVGGLAAVHGNDIDDEPATMWFLAQAGPRLHLLGGRGPVEPVLGVHVGWVRSLVRWTDAGSAADGLALGADVGVQLRLTSRLGLAFLGSATLPYWTRVCEADRGIRDCHRRSELTDHDLQRYFFVTSLALIARLR
jgi:hypothetical protein